MTYTTIHRFVITWIDSKHFQSYHFFTVWSSQTELAIKAFQAEHPNGIIFRIDRSNFIEAAL